MLTVEQRASADTIVRLFGWTTAWDDLAQRDSVTAASEIHNLSERFREIVERIEEGLNRGGFTDEAARFIRSRSNSAIGALGAFDAKATPLTCALWFIGEQLLTAWSIGITVLGPEEAAWPRVFAPQLRTLFLSLGDVRSPTVNNQQFLETFIQRFALPIPNQAAYTAALFDASIYKTSAYTASTAAASMLLVGIIVGVPEIKNLYEQRRLKQISSFYQQMEERPADHVELGNLAQDDVAAILKEVEIIVERYALGNATHHQVTQLRQALQRLIECVVKIAVKPQDAANPHSHTAEKLPILILGGITVAGQMMSVVGKPLLLVDTMRWAAFFLYKLTKSTFNPAHSNRDTAQLFCSIGTGAFITFPTVSAPLLANPAVFTDTTALAISVVFTCLLNITIPHLIAPAGLWIFERVAVMIGYVRRLLNDNSAGTEDIELSEANKPDGIDKGHPLLDMVNLEMFDGTTGVDLLSLFDAALDKTSIDPARYLFEGFVQDLTAIIPTYNGD